MQRRRQSSRLRIFRRAVIVLVLLVTVVFTGGYLWLRRSLPRTNGTIKVAGISASLEIVRDSDAVPHIQAQTIEDALFGLGYVHAQDRLWQMEFQRRIGNGRLSEFAGPSQLDTDKFLRTLGVARAARSAVERLSADELRPIESYVAGVNAFITGRERALPIEFTILGIDPEPWRPEDVIVWGKMMAWDLAGDWSVDLMRARLVQKLGLDKASELLPAYVPNGPVILPDSKVASPESSNAQHRHSQSERLFPGAHIDGLLAINRTLKADLRLGGSMVGSNNWVIGGGRTSTGKPFLANDPHLGARIPSIWYLAHISGGTVDAIGATLPGVPAIIIGHNQRIAWGVTNTGPDVQDWFVEHVNDKDEAEFKGVWEPLQIVNETIKVKGQPDVTIRVRISRHGPLMSDVIRGAEHPMALRWTALDPDDHLISVFMGINRAQHWKDFAAALRDYTAPMQNFVFADVDGNVGYYAPGKLPIRAKGNGTLPVEGWTGANEWIGYVPFDELPHSVNPQQGYVATANNKVMPDSYKHFIGSRWAAPFRAARIVELIESKPKLSFDDMVAIQADQRSTLARQILPILLSAKANSERERQIVDLLRNWDGNVRGDSAAAATFEAWYQAVPRRLLLDEIGEEIWNDYGDESSFIAMMLTEHLKRNDSPWCDDIRTAGKEDCPTTLGAALTDGLAHMARLQDTEDVTTWRWDRVHRALFPHNVLDNTPLKALFSRSVPNGGDNFTVNVATINQSRLYDQTHGPSYRQVLDLSNWENSVFMHTVGQSGNVLSSSYSNLIQRWQRVEYLPMRYSPSVIAKATAGRLVLQP